MEIVNGKEDKKADFNHKVQNAQGGEVKVCSKGQECQKAKHWEEG
jgi:hypothetical protein